MKRICIGLVLLFVFVSFAAAQDTLWTGHYGLVGNTELGYCGDIAPDGGFIVGGESSNFPGGDMWMARCDANGDTMWTRNYGADRWQMAYAVAHVEAGGSDGGFIACGEYSVAVGDYDMYVVRIDPNGDTLWTRKFGTPGHSDYGREIIQTADGGFLAVGQGYNSTNGTSDLYMVKIDVDGNLVWSDLYGSPSGSDYGYGAVELPDGGFAITGTYYGSGNSNIWLLRTDSIGDTLWTRNYDLHGEGDRGDDIALADDGGFVIGGRTSISTHYHMVAMKADSLGNFLWSHEYINAISDFAESIDNTPDGGFVLCGGNSSPFDYYVVRIDSLGDSLWAATYDYDGLPGDSEDSFEIRVNPDSTIMVFGYADTQTGTGADDDCWVVKIHDGVYPPAGCDYAVGDVNGSDNYNGLDITYGVAFLKGGPDPLCADCSADDCNSWSYCGDVNGSCTYNGLDITYGVAFFKGGPGPISCTDCPPIE